MSDYDNRDQGALFANKDRKTDKHPNAKGSINTVCPHCQKDTDFWLSAWTNTSKAGQKYQSLKVQPKEEAHNAGMAQAQDAAYQAPPTDMDDDIPF